MFLTAMGWSSVGMSYKLANYINPAVQGIDMIFMRTIVMVTFYSAYAYHKNTNVFKYNTRKELYLILG